MRLRLKVLLSVAAVLALNSANAAVACSLGLTICISTQGTRIPSAKVIAMLERCDEFITDDIGTRVVRMSQKQMLDQSKGKMTPIALAWYAYDELHDSPLQFDRTLPMERRYQPVKRACLQLLRDFNDDSKWK